MYANCLSQIQARIQLKLVVGWVISVASEVDASIIIYITR